ncbi:uncharacterized protein PGRI_035930 [Penicillium griseofulvum]|uniref:Uncharacterized protein n=1 Tax=Penicillium patulum TaxID=5078 RepID=A0A135LD02_PENPA|nr:uncharacterized protein PGRI_035930 [Penicillium griseofulvum]KXG46847.1 hypothetical protein PGRI_035930 [Penicillium griseofulvum]
MKHRNIAAAPLRNIIKLLNNAKIEPLSTEAAISRLEGTQSNDEWREEDDLVEIALTKLERGGRCSHILLSRFESFLYGPFMSPEERRTQERIICIEECLSSASAEPTPNHNDIFFHRLRKVISHLDTYNLDEKDSRIAFLRTELLTAIAAKSKLGRANCKEFAELLDPNGIVISHLNSPGAKAETPTSTRKVPPKPASPRVPSSQTPEPPSQPTCKQNTAISLSPSPTHPPPFPSRSSSLSSLLTPSLKTIDLTGDTMFHVPGAKRQIRRVTASRSSQSNNTATSPSMSSVSSVTPTAATKRPAPGIQPDEISTLPTKRATSDRQLSTSDDIIASASEISSSGTQLSPFNYNIASTPENAASGAPSLSSNNAPSHTGGASSGSQSLTSDIPKQLWGIFLDKHSPLLPALDLDQLKVAFNMAVSHDQLGPNVIDPTLGFCLAVACHLTGAKTLWQGHKW